MTRISRPAPKLGLLINSIDVFCPEAKDRTEHALRALFDDLRATGAIHADSRMAGRVSNPHEASAAATEFAAACVDLVILANIAFPNGNVFVTIATNPHLARIPLAVMAEPEPGGPEWGTNAWCGVIMNNWAAKRLHRPLVCLSGRVDSVEFRDQLDRLLRVAGTIQFLRNDYLGRFGDAPGGFHSATGNQLAFAATFGTKVDTVDLTAVMNAFETGRATGYLGECAFTTSDVQTTVNQLKQNHEISVDDPTLERGVRLFHAYRAIIRANGYTSGAFRCWPEHNEPYIRTSACLAIGMLVGTGEIASAACESDWPTAVAQTIGTMLSGRPATCLDFVNYTGGSEIVQLGHCGMGICGQMAEEAGAACGCIGYHPVLRQAGVSVGPVHDGQYAYGPKTGVSLTEKPDGTVSMLVFRGESSPETSRGLRYSAADVRVPDYRRLNEMILDHGFPHHLAVAHGDILEDLRTLCSYLGVEFLSPHGVPSSNSIREL